MDPLPNDLSAAQAIELGTVVGFRGPVISVRIASCAEPLEATALHTSTDALPLAEGDSVLVWQSVSSPSIAVILGRIGPTASQVVRGVTDDSTPDTLVLEAKESLTLKVGDGSIEIRADGKILIKGTDLVSHAKRMNRIKGGAVSIN